MSKSILEKIENNITDKVEKIILLSLSVLLGVFALLFVVRSCLLYGGDGDKRAILKKQMSSLTEVHEFKPESLGDENTYRRMIIGEGGVLRSIVMCFRMENICPGRFPAMLAEGVEMAKFRF